MIYKEKVWVIILYVTITVTWYKNIFYMGAPKLNIPVVSQGMVNTYIDSWQIGWSVRMVKRLISAARRLPSNVVTSWKQVSECPCKTSEVTDSKLHVMETGVWTPQQGIQSHIQPTSCWIKLSVALDILWGHLNICFCGGTMLGGSLQAAEARSFTVITDQPACCKIYL